MQTREGVIMSASEYCRNCPRTISSSRSPYCSACRPTEAIGPSSRSMVEHYTPDPEIGLFGGRWLIDPVTRVLRWSQEREPVQINVASCPECGDDFTRIDSRRRYCSDSCRREREKAVERERMRRKRHGEAA